MSIEPVTIPMSIEVNDVTIDSTIETNEVTIESTFDAKIEVVEGGDISVQSLTVTENGTTTAPTGKAYSPVIVNVPNSYTNADEGKVVQNGALTSQTSTTKSANGTYDTTTNNQITVSVPASEVDTGTKPISTNGTHDVVGYASAAVSVPNTYTASDEGKVVDSGALVSQTSTTVTTNGTYDTTTNDEVVVNVSGGTPTLITKTITENGTYSAEDDDADGYSEVTVNVSGGGTKPTVDDYVQTDLIHLWDGEKNTPSGHNDTTTTWYDLIGNMDMSAGSNLSWGDSYAFLGGQSYSFTADAGLSTSDFTVEVALEVLSGSSMNVIRLGPTNRILCFYADDTFNFDGNSTKSYLPGVTTNGLIKTVSCAYNSTGTSGTVYANGVSCVKSNTNHSFGTGSGNLNLGTNANSYPTICLIHCVRIYGRNLTAEEIAANYQIDLKRFYSDDSAALQILIGGVS